jgi:hypothetical protein
MYYRTEIRLRCLLEVEDRALYSTTIHSTSRWYISSYDSTSYNTVCTNTMASGRRASLILFLVPSRMSLFFVRNFGTNLFIENNLYL